VLVEVLEHIDGPVLELGAGFGTFFMHWICQGRELHTYESNEAYYELVRRCESDTHHVHHVTDWDDADIERPWGVALVDHAPPERRRVEAARLAPFAQCVLIHDSQWYAEKHYHYKKIYPLFKYRRDTPIRPETKVLSNFVDVGAWD
jgi:hypothetical protein